MHGILRLVQMQREHGGSGNGRERKGEEGNAFLG